MSKTPKIKLEKYLSARLHEIRTMTVSAAFEARCGWFLESRLDNFILSGEGASYDAGLVVGQQQSQLPQDSLARLCHVIDNHHNEKCIIPIDFKTNSPCVRSVTGEPMCNYNIFMGARQTECALVIIQNPATPDLVVALPLHTLMRLGRGNSWSHRAFRQMPVHVNGVEPYPIELIPFLMPFDFLDDAVRNIERMYHDPTLGWINPSNGLRVKNLPKPVLVKAEYLKPEAESFLRDLETVQRLSQIFKNNCSDIRIERCMIRGATGDFQIVAQSKAHGIVRASVEIKHNACRYSATTHRFTHKSTWRETERPFFSVETNWDFLFSTMSNTNHALFVSFDDLPVHWKHGNPNRLLWQAPSAVIQKNLVPFVDGPTQSSPQTLVSMVRATLEARLESHGTLRATGSSNVTSQPSLDNEPNREERKRRRKRKGQKKNEEKGKGRGNGKGKGKGKGKRKGKGKGKGQTDQGGETQGPIGTAKGKRRLIDDLYALTLNQQCRERKYGWVYRLGIHPTASYILVPIKWGQRPPWFCELPMSTPVIYINFAQVDQVDAIDSRFRNRPSTYTATHGIGASVYVMSAHPPQFAGRGLNYYLVPSSKLDGDGRLKDSNEKHLAEGKRDKNKPFTLVGDVHMASTSCAEADIISTLLRLYVLWSEGTKQEPSDETWFTAGHFMEGNVTTKLTLLQRILDMEHERTTTTSKIRQMLLGRDYGFDGAGRQQQRQQEGGVGEVEG